MFIKFHFQFSLPSILTLVCFCIHIGSYIHSLIIFVIFIIFVLYLDQLTYLPLSLKVLRLELPHFTTFFTYIVNFVSQKAAPQVDKYFQKARCQLLSFTYLSLFSTLQSWLSRTIDLADSDSCCGSFGQLTFFLYPYFINLFGSFNVCVTTGILLMKE